MTTIAAPFDTYTTIKHVTFTDRLGRVHDFNKLVEVNLYVAANGAPVMVEKKIASDNTEEGRAILDAYRAAQQPQKASTPQPGDRVDITGTIVYHDADTYMSTISRFIILKDDAGTSWKLNTSAQFGAHVDGFRDQLGWTPGNTLTLTATIKDTGDYNGVPSHTITRPRLRAFTLGPRALKQRDKLITARDSHPCMAHKVDELTAEYAATDHPSDLHTKLNRYEDHERFNCPTHRAKTFEYPTAG